MIHPNGEPLLGWGMPYAEAPYLATDRTINLSANDHSLVYIFEIAVEATAGDSPNYFADVPTR